MAAGQARLALIDKYIGHYSLNNLLGCSVMTTIFTELKSGISDAVALNEMADRSLFLTVQDPQVIAEKTAKLLEANFPADAAKRPPKLDAATVMHTLDDHAEKGAYDKAMGYNWWLVKYSVPGPTGQNDIYYLNREA